jgi:ATP-binding cassette subfamily B protein/subfamily B ATP-binding cassette protein MsbA
MSTRVVETMTAIRLVKSHAREDYEHARFSAVARENASAWIDVGRQSTVFAITTAALTIAGSSAILVVGGLSVLDGRLSLGTLLLVIAYLGYVYGPLSAIAHTTNELQHAFASARRVQAEFAIEPERAEHGRPATGVRGEIAFEDVTVSYGGAKPALDRVTFTARPGELIALVGPSGAGKSTLATAIARFYEPSAGTIRLDGVALADYELRSLRRNVALVLQEAIVVAGSVADNLRYGRSNASDAEVERAARAADAHDFISELPDGYATMIGDGARALSGGQRQRLGIARAFLKDAPVLVFDEPTSALDTIAEERIVDGMRRLAAGRTTFVVAHRLSTVRHADRILVLDQGKIVADGDHATLLVTSPLYQRLAAQLAIPDDIRVTQVA